MNTETSRVRYNGAERAITAKPCAICGHTGLFLDLPAGSHITHTCPTVRSGPSWTVYGPAPR